MGSPRKIFLHQGFFQEFQVVQALLDGQLLAANLGGKIRKSTLLI